MLYRLLASIFVCLVSINPSLAEELTQADLNQAARQHLSASERLLNKAYNRLHAELEPNRQALLKSTQHTWLAYRNSNARLISDAYRGGSISSLIYTQVLIEMTGKRTSELTRMHLDEITP